RVLVFQEGGGGRVLQAAQGDDARQAQRGIILPRQHGDLLRLAQQRKRVGTRVAQVGVIVPPQHFPDEADGGRRFHLPGGDGREGAHARGIIRQQGGELRVPRGQAGFAE